MTDYPPTGEAWSDQDFATFFEDFDKSLLSLVETLQSELPFEDCRAEVETFIGKFAGGRDDPRWANMSLGERYTFINLPARNRAPFLSWIIPRGLSSEALRFWQSVIQDLPRFSLFHGTPRQQSKIREELVDVTCDYLDVRGYDIPDPNAAKPTEVEKAEPPGAHELTPLVYVERARNAWELGWSLVTDIVGKGLARRAAGDDFSTLQSDFASWKRYNPRPSHVSEVELTKAHADFRRYYPLVCNRIDGLPVADVKPWDCGWVEVSHSGWAGGNPSGPVEVRMFECYVSKGADEWRANVLVPMQQHAAEWRRWFADLKRVVEPRAGGEQSGPAQLTGDKQEATAASEDELDTRLRGVGETFRKLLREYSGFGLCGERLQVWLAYQRSRVATLNERQTERLEKVRREGVPSSTSATPSPSVAGPEFAFEWFSGRLKLDVPPEVCVAALFGNREYDLAVRSWLVRLAKERPELFRGNHTEPEGHNYEFLYCAEIPPELSVDNDPDIQVFPVPDRALTLVEKYAALSAIHDYYWKGELLNPWTSEVGIEEILAGMPFAALLNNVPDVLKPTEDYVPETGIAIIEDWLCDIKKDLDQSLTLILQPRELDVLKAIGESSVRITGVELETKHGLPTRKHLGPILKTLLEYELIENSKGVRKGYAITAKGREFLSLALTTRNRQH